MTDLEYGQWVAGVLGGISAPLTAINSDTLWAWSAAEGGRIHLNPLNTTWAMPNATPWNTLPSGAHVWTYASVEDATTATVLTLLQPGYFPAIVAALQASKPRGEWGMDECIDLQLWGTGCSWFTRDYGAYPGTITEESMTAEEHAWLQAIYNFMSNPEFAKFNQGFDELMAAIKAIPTSGGVALTPAQAQTLQEAHDAILRIEAGLKTA